MRKQVNEKHSIDYVKDYCDTLVYCKYCKEIRPRERRVSRCKKCNNQLYLGVKRHHIGIFPADRAVLAFQGELYSVSFKNYEWLAELGTDVIIIEKAGLVEKLVPFTKDFGIALLHSQGFVSEYGEWLVKVAAKKGAHVIFLTDFDNSGIEIALQMVGVTRLGVDLDTIQWLNNHKGDNDELLNIDELTESSLNKKGEPSTHYDNLKDLVLCYEPQDYTEHKKKYVKYLQRIHGYETYLDFLKSKRIELNTIVNEVHAERFWNWLKSKLLELFPYRDYNRAITVLEYQFTGVFTPTMEQFNKELESTLRHVLRDKVIENEKRLKNIEGLLDTNDELKKIKPDLLKILSSHPLIQQIDLGMKVLKEMMGYYSEHEEP